jgi:hypothetical protein
MRRKRKMKKKIKYFDEFTQQEEEIEYECERCYDSGYITISPDMDGITRTYLCDCKAGQEIAKEIKE